MSHATGGLTVSSRRRLANVVGVVSGGTSAVVLGAVAVEQAILSAPSVGPVDAVFVLAFAVPALVALAVAYVCAARLDNGGEGR